MCKSGFHIRKLVLLAAWKAKFYILSLLCTTTSSDEVVSTMYEKNIIRENIIQIVCQVSTLIELQFSATIGFQCILQFLSLVKNNFKSNHRYAIFTRIIILLDVFDVKRLQLKMALAMSIRWKDPLHFFFYPFLRYYTFAENKWNGNDTHIGDNITLLTILKYH